MTERLRVLATRPWCRDLIAFSLLFGLSGVSAGFLLRDDLFIYGDHPGQFMRLWVPLRVSHRLLGWNPLWYAGYPELQFYPPGFVLLGWALDWMTLRRVSPFLLYQIVLFGAYLLPGLSVYLLTSRATARRWVGLCCGGVALLFTGLWGGATAVFVGLVAERLAFGLVPLVMAGGWQALHGRHPVRWWWITSLALAATMLMHPFHAAAPLLFLGVAALTRPGCGRRLAELALAALLSLGLIAFWWLPLAVRHQYAASMIRADWNQTLDWLFDPSVRPYYAISLVTLPAIWGQRRQASLRLVAAALITSGLLILFIVLDHQVLIERLEISFLDPVRFSAEVYLMGVLSAGMGLAHLPIRLSQRGWGWRGWLAGGAICLAAVVWLGQPFLDLMRNQRDPAHFLSRARQDFPLDATWEVLRTDAGRVLFTSSYLTLGETPTALKSLTPYFVGRAIVGGTFSHWSPVARALWVGDKNADLLPGRVELTDDVSLAGRLWTEWTDSEFFELCHRLYVTTVVTTWDDVNARTFLDRAPHFQSDYSNNQFVLYRVLDPAPALVEARGAAVTLLRDEATALDLAVSEARNGAILHVRITDYPLWQARIGEQRLSHQADELGLMQIALPPGSYTLSLRYRPGLAEQAGATLSLASALVGWVGWILSLRSQPVRSTRVRPA
ncbi:MAG: hypothetical protein ACUVWZ_13580 [Anaerolineae bacterium]